MTMNADEHLRHALKHAPDAELAAPSHVSAQIIAAAHRAAAESAPRAATTPARWWQRRGAVWGGSGAFATVLMAGVLGLMWRGEPLPGPAQDVPWTEPVETSPAAAPVTPAAHTPAPDAAPAKRAPSIDEQRQVAAAARQRETQQRTIPDERQQAMRQEQRRAFDAASVQRVMAPAPVPAPTADSAPPPPPAPPPPAEAAAPAVAPATTSSTAPMPTRSRIAEMSQALDAGSTPARMRPPIAEAPPSRMNFFAAWLRARPAGVDWRIAEAPRVAAAPAWLQALASAADGRWQSSANAVPEAGATAIVLWEGSTATAQLWLGETSVLWCEQMPRCMVAPLERDTARALRERLSR